MNPLQKVGLLSITVVAVITMIVGCSSSSSSPNHDGDTSDRTSSDTTSSPTYSPQAQCPLSVEDAIAEMSNAGNITDPLAGSTPLRLAITKAKFVWVKVAADPNCQPEKDRLRTVLPQYWQQSIHRSYLAGSLVAQSQKLLCISGCNFVDAGADCKSQCQSSYQSSLDELGQQRESDQKEMSSFFN